MKPYTSIEKVRGREWQSWNRECQLKFIEDAVDYWRERGFPYFWLSDLQVSRELELLVKYSSARLFVGDKIRSSNLGLRLANYFHPQMWHVRCTRYASPYDTFMDNTKLTDVIHKSLSICPDRYGASASGLRRILRSYSNTVGVSNFRPTVAKGIIQLYCRPCGTVLDFCAGYGGRLLGAMVLNCDYLGIDPALAQAKGLRNMARVCRSKLGYKGSVRILKEPAEEIMPKLPNAAFDLVFSSPPYFDREKYSDDSNQSYVRYPSLQEWLEGFIKPVLKHSARVLKQGGHFVINISNSPDRLADFVKANSRRSLKFEKEWKMILAKLPYKRASKRDYYKEEPILVFRKS